MTPASAPIEGLCDVRFGAVRDAFAESFARGEEVGAAVSVVVDGRSVVDLCGGPRRPGAHAALDARPPS